MNLKGIFGVILYIIFAVLIFLAGAFYGMSTWFAEEVCAYPGEYLLCEKYSTHLFIEATIGLLFIVIAWFSARMGMEKKKEEKNAS